MDMPKVERRRARAKISAGALALSAIGVVAILGSAAFIFAKPKRPVGLPGDISAAASPAPPSATEAAPDDGNAQAPPPENYLADGATLDPQILESPPEPSSVAGEAERRVFQATRALAGSPRWALARRDDDQSIAGTLDAFSCAMGVTLTPSNVPGLASLLTDLEREESQSLQAAKQYFKRPRPYLSQSGDICVAKTYELANSPEYPSGHATWGWMTALLLAEIAPDHARDILVRGRAYGESRVICGVHTPSAVEAGRVEGAAFTAALHSSHKFKVDLEVARGELEAARQSGQAPDQARCAAESALLAKRYY